ncbi:MAG: choice-of-anchor B family protein [Bacteroidota bacterium]|jgi:choice-of-anchor B domain-containing protein
MKKIFTFLLFAFSNAICFSQNYNITLASQVPYNPRTLANICGYAANGKEYALVGAEDGMDIVDVTNPSNPVQIVQIPNITNLWKEIKVYSHYAYVTTEGGGGLQIVDLSNLPGTNLNYHSYTGDGSINGQLTTIHALHIDTTKKFVYLYGSNLFNGGAIALDINVDPYNPTYAGHYENNSHAYVHDGYVDNDTLYAGHIYAGVFTVVDMTNKSNPVILAEQQTPTAFTHNTWLSNDHKNIFTTDENSDSYLASYDISNLNNIIEKDRIRATPGSGSVVHNTHILNNWAVTSWYRDGVTIVDITRPHNMVEVGRYDTYAGSGNGFDGAWGVYPFLPSGTMVVSNIDEGLFVLSPNYVRACYLEGNVVDSACGTPLTNVTITISSVNVIDSTAINGDYATGTAFPGTYNVTFSKPGYTSKTISGVTFAPGVVNNLNVQLFSPGAINLNGNVIDASTSNGLSGVSVTLSGSNNYSFTTDAQGNFSSCSVVGGTYTVTTGAWGYETVCNTETINSSTPNISEALAKQYYDDFTMDLGWTINSTASSGVWERGVPIGTTVQGTAAAPGNDVSTDCTDKAFVTGNAGGSASQDDIDNGYTILTSPIFDLSSYTTPYVHYDRWFYNGGGAGNPNDSLTIKISNGSQTVTLETVTASSANNSTWVHSVKNIAQFITPTSTMQLIVRCADASPGHLVEGGFDKFFIVDSLSSGLNDLTENTAQLNVFPNPFNSELKINWKLLNNDAANLTLVDLSGRAIRQFPIYSESGTIVFNDNLEAGIYLVKISQKNRTLKVIRVVKTN